jgi:glycosyltransferase involved in cell wall biosynthesis
MRLHMLGLPHTRTTALFSHCAFTGKVRRWAPMLAPLGFSCWHYGVGTADSVGWERQIEVMTPAEQEKLLGYDPTPSTQFVGRDANTGHPLYTAYNSRLRELLNQYVAPGDIICAPFGGGHLDAFRHKLNQVVETGIGYPDCVSAYRIYESTAWLHRHLEKEKRWPWDSEWVVPNYFDPAEWPLRSQPNGEGDYVLFLGRLGALKGLDVVWALAKAMPEERFVICGQGDPSPWLGLPNLIYQSPVHGIERARLFTNAKCAIFPSRFVEPFGGVAVECMLTGTVALGPDHSAFRDTLPEEYRCHTQSDWVAGIRAAGRTEPTALRAYGIAHYSLGAVGPKYARIFRKIPAMWEKGWYA